jgi:hypothetical protein
MVSFMALQWQPLVALNTAHSPPLYWLNYPDSFNLYTHTHTRPCMHGKSTESFMKDNDSIAWMPCNLTIWTENLLNTNTYFISSILTALRNMNIAKSCIITVTGTGNTCSLQLIDSWVRLFKIRVIQTPLPPCQGVETGTKNSLLHQFLRTNCALLDQKTTSCQLLRSETSMLILKVVIIYCSILLHCVDLANKHAGCPQRRVNWIQKILTCQRL